MQVITEARDFGRCDKKISLTIGNFDGVHLGHKLLLERMQANRVVVTFSNHPAAVLKRSSPPLLITLPHKLALLKAAGIQTTLLLTFTKELSQTSAKEFLTLIKKHIPFSSLTLGYDATLGHKKEGDQNHILTLAKKLHFDVEYLPCFHVESTPVSSSHIRSLITKGDLKNAAAFLGRPYSIYAPVEKGQGKGRLLGFKTANLDVEGLALPPLGVYAVQVRHLQKIYLGVANLGYAPTIHNLQAPKLEVHLLDRQEDLYGQEIEVIFLKFLREEKKFASIELLKSQIEKDISQLALH